MRFADSYVKPVLRRGAPWLRAEQRQTAACVSQPLFRECYGVSRRQVARYLLSRRTVRFGPDYPTADAGYVIIKALVRLGVRATREREPRAPEAAFAWSDNTVVPAEQFAPLVAAYGRVINGGCLDIGKDRVERLHRSVFGYGMSVDPRGGGPVLRKSVKNGRHDVHVFAGAVEFEPGYVYQRPLNNGFWARLFEEVRLPWVGGCLPVCWVKLKVDERRFASMPGLGDLRAVESGELFAAASAVPTELMFTAEETAQIDRFAQQLGLDYGEFDVIRDVDDGRIYVFDANKTPSGPTIVMGEREMRRYLNAYASAVDELISRFKVG